MTVHRDLKDHVRARMAVTGESYTAARAALFREALQRESEQAAASRTAPVPAVPIADREASTTGQLHATEPVDAVVLKANARSARVRVIGEKDAITLRGAGVYNVLPGQIARVLVTKRWKHREHEYATGAMVDARIDIPALGLEPLPLEDQGVLDLRESSEPFEAPDPYAPMWRKLTKPARKAWEFHSIAWEGPNAESDDETDLPVTSAAELVDAGDDAGAIKLLNGVLAEDLRCIDAHAHLGNIEFRSGSKRALIHYEIGMRIGELSLGPFFTDMLPWGFVYNRAFLRCLHGYGLAKWRLGDFDEALRAFERVCSLNPDDHQGIRFLLDDVREHRPWHDDDEPQRTLN